MPNGERIGHLVKDWLQLAMLLVASCSQSRSKLDGAAPALMGHREKAQGETMLKNQDMQSHIGTVHDMGDVGVAPCV